MNVKYLCKSCCKKLGVMFCGMADNQAGRKCCSECGNNWDWELHIEEDKT